MLRPTRKPFSAKNLRPVAVDLGAVGLDGVPHGHAGPRVPLAELHGAAEELEPHQRGLAALPGDLDLGRAVRLDELADVQLERLVAHARLRVRVQAAPSRGRSSRRSRGCTSSRSAWPAGGTTAAGRWGGRSGARRRKSAVQRPGEAPCTGRRAPAFYRVKCSGDGAGRPCGRPARVVTQLSARSAGSAQRPRRRARRFMPASETGESGRPKGSMKTETSSPFAGRLPSSMSTV